LPYEFRTTIVPGLHEFIDIKKMGELISGADKWYLQQFKSDTGLVNSDFEGKNALNGEEMRKWASEGGKYVKQCVFRG